MEFIDFKESSRFYTLYLLLYGFIVMCTIYKANNEKFTIWQMFNHKIPDGV